MADKLVSLETATTAYLSSICQTSSRTSWTVGRGRTRNRGWTRQVQDLRGSPAPSPACTVRRRCSRNRLAHTRARPSHRLELETRGLSAEGRPGWWWRNAARRPDAGCDCRAGRWSWWDRSRSTRLRRECVARSGALWSPASVRTCMRYCACRDGGAAAAGDGDSAQAKTCVDGAGWTDRMCGYSWARRLCYRPAEWQS